MKLLQAMRRRSCLLAALGLALAALTGCSKVRAIDVTSLPPGASIALLEQGQNAGPRRELGKTPLSQNIDFGSKGEKQFQLVATLDRYESQTRPLAYAEGSGPLAIRFELKEIYRFIDLVQFQSTAAADGLRQRGGRVSTRAFIDPAETSSFARETQRVTDKLPDGEFYMGAIHSPTEDLLIVPILKTTRDPLAGTHRVASGERLDELAARYRTTPDALAKANALQGTSLQEGQMLKVPGDVFLSQLWRMVPMAAGTKAALTEGEHLDLDPAFSNDGTKVFFSSPRQFPNATLHTIPSDSQVPRTEVTQLQSLEDVQPSASGNGQELFFTRNAPSAKQPQIYRCRTDGNVQAFLANGESPAASPDGRRVAFVRRHPTTGLRSIWIMNSDGTAQGQLSPVADYDSADPAWSLDGQWIAFTSNQAKDSQGQRNFDIWVMRADGTDRKQITSNGSWDDKPAFDKAGRLYFRSNRGGDWNLWRTKPELR